MTEKKEKQYVSDNAQLMAEWNWKKNDELNFNPSQLTLGSHEKVWWKCSKGHEWQTTIYNRNDAKGCPYCSGRYTIKGENDLQTVNPTLAKEWNYNKNNGLTPSDVMPGSGKMIWWKCSNGHEWQASVKDRNNGNGCPYCSGRYVVKGENDLQTINPTLAKEWNYNKNNGLTPSDVMPNSNKKVWWKCSNGHEWQAIINGRNKGVGCPYCAGKRTIKGENDLQTVNPALAKEWNYNKNNGLTPFDVMPSSGKKVWWKCNKGHEWQATIDSRKRGNGCPVCNSERNTSFPEYAIVYYLTKSGLEAIHSFKDYGYELDVYIPSKKIAVEYDGYYWHKNKTKSDLVKNQKCKKDGIKLYRIREDLPPLNEFSRDFIIQKKQKNLSEILSKVLSEITESNVDIDIERDYIAIENLREYKEKQKSFLLSYPKIAEEWNCEKNENMRPEYYLPNSDKKVWWKCSKGHEWQATISSRSNGNGCPYCSGKKVLPGYNDLQSVNPNLVKEWNYNKNEGMEPANFTANSSKKVWWKCCNGHEWQTSIYHRNKGSGCPICAGQKVLKGFNDLLTVNPALAKEWNYNKNDELTPSDVMPNSTKKVWWTCNKGHEWQATISNRSKGKGCPYCSGRYAIKGENDLQTINPTLAKEWNYNKNDRLTPSDVMPNSHKEVWWICNKGHEWQATIDSRNRGNGCPQCAIEKRKSKK